jgi:hypothetical protein
MQIKDNGVVGSAAGERPWLPKAGAWPYLVRRNGTRTVGEAELGKDWTDAGFPLCCTLNEKGVRATGTESLWATDRDKKGR